MTELRLFGLDRPLLFSQTIELLQFEHASAVMEFISSLKDLQVDIVLASSAEILNFPEQISRTYYGYTFSQEQCA